MAPHNRKNRKGAHLPEQLAAKQKLPSKSQVGSVQVPRAAWVLGRGSESKRNLKRPEITL